MINFSFTLTRTKLRHHILFVLYWPFLYCGTCLYLSYHFCFCLHHYCILKLNFTGFFIVHNYKVISAYLFELLLLHIKLDEVTLYVLFPLMMFTIYITLFPSFNLVKLNKYVFLRFWNFLCFLLVGCLCWHYLYLERQIWNVFLFL